MEKIETIITQWSKLREFPKEKLKVSEVGHYNPWDYKVQRDLNEAFELDPEGFTALCILDNFREDFFESCGISIKDILNNPDFAEFIRECQRLSDMLSDPEIIAYLQSFMDRVASALEAMGVVNKEVYKEVWNRYTMGYLRRDALKSMKQLCLHQFYQGETATDHLKFLPDIHMFWNVNSLVKTAWQSPDGVSLNLVKDPMDAFSYFAFMVKNGGNLTIITDKPKMSHPLQKYMTRKPERNFTERVFKNHFPYELLKLTVDQEGYLWASGSEIVPYQDKPIKIGNLLECEPETLIWVVMMFSLIDAKLYKENYHCGELSYTSDMLQDPEIGLKLLESGSSALVAADYRCIEVPKLTVDDLDDDDEQYAETHHKGHRCHDWLVKRFKDQVPDNILNGLRPASAEASFLLPNGEVVNAPKGFVKRDTFDRETYLKADAVKDSNLPITSYYGVNVIKGTHELEKMTGDDFGSREQLLADYRWFARYNEAVYINKLAWEEFNERKNEVYEWVRKRIDERIQTLCDEAIRNRDLSYEEHPAYYRYFGIKEYGGWDFSGAKVYVGKKDFRKHWSNSGNSRCYFTDAPCSYLVGIKFINAESLAYACGCRVEELPEPLRHYHSDSFETPYTGNHLLSRIDPMDWKLKDPWWTMKFDVLIGVGKKYYQKRRKTP